MRSGGTRRRRHDSESDGSSSESDSRSGGCGGGDRKRRKREKKERKAAKKAAKKARKRERKEEKRARKRAKREARADGRRSPTPPPRAGGLEMRSREIADAERAAREEEAKRDTEAAKAAAERASKAAKAAAEAETAAAETAAAEAAAAVADAAPPVPGFGAAMTLEQYRALAAAKPHMKGTFHATPQEEKDAAEDKAKKGWWPCQSYRCTRGSGQPHEPQVRRKVSTVRRHETPRRGIGGVPQQHLGRTVPQKPIQTCGKVMRDRGVDRSVESYSVGGVVSCG